MNDGDVDDGNIYEVETIIQLNVTFYNTALNQPADPTNVAVFVEDQNGVVTQLPLGSIVRTGVGQYYANFLPTAGDAGRWKYKWQGTGNVVATSPDRHFFVRASELVT